MLARACWWRRYLIRLQRLSIRLYVRDAHAYKAPRYVSIQVGPCVSAEPYTLICTSGKSQWFQGISLYQGSEVCQVLAIWFAFQGHHQINQARVLFCMFWLANR